MAMNFGLLNTNIPAEIGAMPGNALAARRQRIQQDEDRAMGREQAQMTNALSRMQLTKAQGDMDEEAAYKNALRGVQGGNYEQAMPDLLQASPSRALALQKQLGETKKGDMEMTLKRFEIIDRAAGQFAANPTRQSAMQSLQMLQSIGTPPEVLQQMQARLEQTPDEQLPQLAREFLASTQEGIKAQTASLFPKAAAPSNLAQLIAERDALPPGDPRRTEYDRAISKTTTHAPAASINNYGQPVSAVDPQTGQPVLVQFSKDGTPKVAPFAPYNAAAAEVTRKKEAGSKSAIQLLDEAEQWVDKATGSGAGALRDSAGRLVGMSSEASQASARLSALQGALMMAQPRMEGPQSNLDVALYERMAGRIGDPSIPAAEKRAAMDTIRNLHQKYAGGGAQPAAPQVSPQQATQPAAFDSMPNPAQYSGKAITDTASGIRYRSNGSQWVRE